MRDCTNVRIRELLPDLLHDRLTAVLRVEVEAHVSGCADCRAELALLRQVIAVSVAPRVDTGRIASAIPPYRPMPLWRRSMTSRLGRIAAAIVLIVGGSALIVTVANRGRSVPATPRSATVPVSATTPLPEVASAPITGASTSTPSAESPKPVTELAVGEAIHDLSEAELRALLDEMKKLDGVTSSETESVVPSPARERGAM